MGPKSYESVSIRDRKDTQRHREEGLVMMQAEVGMKHRKAKECQGWPGMVSPSQPREGTNPANSLISHFWPPKLRENI